MSPRKRVEPGPTAAEQITQSLRSRILSSELSPGQALREETLAEEYDASRHTVRTALAALVGERLAHSEPYRGIWVTELGDDELRALQQYRCALESEAVRLLRERHNGQGWSAEVLAPIELALEQLAESCARLPEDWSAIEEAHASVHSAIVSAAQSPRITEAHHLLEGELRLLMLHAKPLYSAAELPSQHRQLVADLQASGAAALRAHLELSTEGLIRSRQ